jgi:NADH dehydrogenase
MYTRIVILGGGFGGVTMARHLERLCKRRRDVEIVLVSRDNFVMLTPLLFEVCSGALDARHCSLPFFPRPDSSEPREYPLTAASTSKKRQSEPRIISREQGGPAWSCRGRQPKRPDQVRGRTWADFTVR